MARALRLEPVRWNAAVAALAATWGLVSVIVAGVDLDAGALVFYRLALAALALGAAMLVAGRAAAFPMPRPRVRPALVGVVLGLHWLLFFQTIKLSSVAFAILVVYTGPIFLAIVAPFLLPERRSRIVFAALPVAATGIATMALAEDDSTSGGAAALATGLGAAVTFAALIILTKQVLVYVPALTLQLWNCTIGALVLAPFLLAADRVVPHGIEIPSVILLGVVFTAAMGLAYVWLVGRVRAQAVGVLGYIEPVSAALLAWAILGQAVTWPVAVGGSLVVAAGVLVVLYEPAEPAAVEAPIPAPRCAA